MGLDNRRTQRIPVSMAIEISYADAQGTPRLERTHTLEVGRNGARLASRSFHQTGSMIHVGIPQLGRSAHTRVVWCSAPANGLYEVGVEMDPSSDLWGLSFEDQAAQPVMDRDLALIVQMLESKGFFSPGEFLARRSGRIPASGPERPSKGSGFMLS